MLRDLVLLRDLFIILEQFCSWGFVFTGTILLVAKLFRDFFSKGFFYWNNFARGNFFRIFFSKGFFFTDAKSLVAKLFRDFFSKGFFYWSNFARSTIVQGFFL